MNKCELSVCCEHYLPKRSNEYHFFCAQATTAGLLSWLGLTCHGRKRTDVANNFNTGFVLFGLNKP